ncbi:MAG: hypothetical protein ACTSV7_14030 [Candidatus Baldrarchaeia archaeon]
MLIRKAFLFIMLLVCFALMFKLTIHTAISNTPYEKLFSRVEQLELDFNREIQEEIIEDAKKYLPNEHAWCVKGGKVEDALIFYADERSVWFLCLGGKEVHSHPSGVPLPSASDIVSYYLKPFPDEFYIVGRDYFDDGWEITRWKLK